MLAHSACASVTRSTSGNVIAACSTSSLDMVSTLQPHSTVFPAIPPTVIHELPSRAFQPHVSPSLRFPVLFSAWPVESFGQMGDQAGQLGDKRLLRQLDGFIEPCGHALALFVVQRGIEELCK